MWWIDSGDAWDGADGVVDDVGADGDADERNEVPPGYRLRCSMTRSMVERSISLCRRRWRGILGRDNMKGCIGLWSDDDGDDDECGSSPSSPLPSPPDSLSARNNRENSCLDHVAVSD